MVKDSKTGDFREKIRILSRRPLKLAWGPYGGNIGEVLSVLLCKFSYINQIINS